MDQRQEQEMLEYLSRIATAVEFLAKKADPNFTPDHSRKLADLLKN